MKIENIRKGAYLSAIQPCGSAQGASTAYYRVLKVCPVKVRVLSETGSAFLAYPMIFDREVNPDAMPESAVRRLNIAN